jgi:hypothetical protein
VKLHTFLCWLFRHRLVKVGRSDDGQLECLYCLRCQENFAMHHPTKYFGLWDFEDTQAMLDLTVRKLP